MDNVKENSIQQQTGSWMLVERRSDDTPPQVIPLSLLPISLGRTELSDVIVDSLVVSKLHVIFMVESGAPVVRDQQSMNGTFVNEKRISSEDAVRLSQGDIVRLANKSYVVMRENAGVIKKPDTIPWTAALMQFEKLMDPGGMVPHYQPIVRLADRQPFGFECLARSDVKDLKQPNDMFNAAGQLEQVAELSEAMRRQSAEQATGMKKPGILFLNTHPREGFGYRMEESLRELRRSAPKLSVAIEVNEIVVENQPSMKRFRELLSELNMKLVYDGFGADEKKLQQLVGVPPDFLKFELEFVRDLDKASERRRELVRSLVAAVHGMNIVSVATGVETEEEAAACTELGFELGQGFFFGRPKPVTEAIKPAEKTPAGA